MLINQDFSSDRTKYIGGSDIGAILGLSRYRTPIDVWMEKTGKENKPLDSLPLRFGSFAEEFVANEYSRATGLALLHDQSAYTHPTHPFMRAHIDRFVLGGSEHNSAAPLPIKVLECKTANPFTKQEWGEAGSDQVPMSYLAQCIWYMALTQINQCDLAVLFGNQDFRIYEITRDIELEQIVIDKAKQFWCEHVLKDTPPPAQSESDYQSLFSKGNLNKCIEAQVDTFELTQQLRELNNEIDIREQKISAMKQNIMSVMKDAETLTYQGKVLATWKAPKPSLRFDHKRFEVEHPELANQYKSPIQSSRRLVFKEIY
jgi:putative phage-type endonuclease